MENQEEVWKDVPGYNGVYQASNLGNIRSVRMIGIKNTNLKRQKIKILRLIENSGYKRINVSVNSNKKWKLVHRMVLSAFVPNPHNLPFVNHKDGVRGNNHIDNLEWCTAKENQRHRFDTLGQVGVGRKLKKEDIVYILNNGARGYNGNIAEIAIKLGVAPAVIRNILNERNYKEMIHEIKLHKN